MTATQQTRLEAARMVADVLVDGSRIDRVLQVAEDGSYYVTTDCDYSRDDGTQFTAPHVRIPVGDPILDDEDEESADDRLLDWGFAILNQLDELIAEGKGESA